MAESVVARRAPALAGCRFERAGISIAPAGAASRLCLRAPASSQAAFTRRLGIKLPQVPKTSAAKGGRAALWLGPDEWLLIDEDGADLAAICSNVPALHSAVDVSHRNVAIIVSGPHAEDVLGAGCPQDLSPARFPAGAASRTVFGKAEIVLWRRSAEDFRIECWRSFSGYVFGLLAAAAREIP